MGRERVVAESLVVQQHIYSPSIASFLFECKPIFTVSAHWDVTALLPYGIRRGDSDWRVTTKLSRQIRVEEPRFVFVSPTRTVYAAFESSSLCPF